MMSINLIYLLKIKDKMKTNSELHLIQNPIKCCLRGDSHQEINSRSVEITYSPYVEETKHEKLHDFNQH